MDPCQFPTFRFFTVNKNTGKYIRIACTLSRSFRGTTAKWILGHQHLDYRNPGVSVEALLNHGATYFQKNYADYCSYLLSRPPFPYGEITVDATDLINMVD